MKLFLTVSNAKIKENPKYLEECMIHVNDAGLYAMLLTSGGSYDIDGGLPELKRFLVEGGEKEVEDKEKKEIKRGAAPWAPPFFLCISEKLCP